MKKNTLYYPPFISEEIKYKLTSVKLDAELIPDGLLIFNLTLTGSKSIHSFKHILKTFEHKLANSKYAMDIQYLLLYPDISRLNVSAEFLKAIGFQESPPNTRLYLPHKDGCLYKEVS